MIPTLILAGILLGRWWKFIIPAAAIAWPLLLIVAGISLGGADVVSAGILAVMNTAVGVSIFLGVRWLARPVS
jgi:hypothetical protein